MRAHKANLTKEDEQGELNEEIRGMESEWVKRRKELLNARREADVMERVKVEEMARRSFPASDVF
jgi:hypothetical protein